MVQMDLILATAGFDYMIRLWSPHNATCFKKLGHRDSQVCFCYIDKSENESQNELR